MARDGDLFFIDNYKENGTKETYIASGIIGWASLVSSAIRLYYVDGKRDLNSDGSPCSDQHWPGMLIPIPVSWKILLDRLTRWWATVFIIRYYESASLTVVCLGSPLCWLHAEALMVHRWNDLPTWWKQWITLHPGGSQSAFTIMPVNPKQLNL